MIRRVLGLAVLTLSLPLAAAPAQESPSDAPPVVEVTAVDYAYEAPDAIPAGWTTFRMTNRGQEAHVAVIVRLPEGVTLGEWQAGLNSYGQTGQEPEWWTEMTTLGGPGLAAPGRTAQATVRLEPGRYVLTCGVHTPEGVSHRQEGMVHAFTVTDQRTGAAAPEPDVTMTLSNHRIETDRPVRRGEQTIRVQFADRDDHDVHLARLAEEQSVKQVVEWMDGVQAPAPVEFVGGIEQMPAGEEGYFTVTLEPGRYVWVCHFYAGRGMTRTFMVQ